MAPHSVYIITNSNLVNKCDSARGSCIIVVNWNSYINWIASLALDNTQEQHNRI